MCKTFIIADEPIGKFMNARLFFPNPPIPLYNSLESKQGVSYQELKDLPAVFNICVMNFHRVGIKCLSIVFMLGCNNVHSGTHALLRCTIFRIYVLLCDKLIQNTVLSVVVLSCIMLMLTSVSCLKNAVCNIKFIQKIRFVLNVSCSAP